MSYILIMIGNPGGQLPEGSVLMWGNSDIRLCISIKSRRTDRLLSWGSIAWAGLIFRWRRCSKRGEGAKAVLLVLQVSQIFAMY